jgi:RNA polymerase sigma-70 factor (ECF subfamily)
VELTSSDGGRLEDEALAVRVADGSRAAFSLLYDRYARSVYAFATHVLGPTRAEDVVQEVFLTLWRKATQFDPRRGPFEVWFMSVARHRVVDELRRRGAEQRLIDFNPIERVLSQAHDVADVEQEAAARERNDTLLRALHELPAEQRRVLVLAYFAGLTHGQLAEALDLPLGTVKKRLKLGLNKLRAALAEGPVTASVRTPPMRQR